MPPTLFLSLIYLKIVMNLISDSKLEFVSKT